MRALRASFLSRWLATVGSLAPIAWPTMVVSHGNEVDIILPDTVNYVERKTLNESLAKFASEGRACLRVNNNPFRCLLNGRQESETESVKPRLIEFE